MRLPVPGSRRAWHRVSRNPIPGEVWQGFGIARSPEIGPGCGQGRGPLVRSGTDSEGREGRERRVGQELVSGSALDPGPN